VVGDEIWLSAKTGAGIELLRGKLLEAAGWQARAKARSWRARVISTHSAAPPAI